MKGSHIHKIISHWFPYLLDGAEDGARSTPRRSLRKSAPEELGAGTSSKLRSSKSTGAAAGLTVPFGTLREEAGKVETVGGTELSFLPLKVASSRTGILSTSADLQEHYALRNALMVKKHDCLSR